MKVYISKGSLIDKTNTDFEDAMNELRNASYKYFSAPSDFKYASEIKNLRSELYSYTRELYKLQYLIREQDYTNRNYSYSSVRRMEYSSEKKIPKANELNINL